MRAFVNERGIVAPILVDNVDTDQIIPSREMKRVSKTGLGAGLFAGWRYEYDGTDKIGLKSDFVLNQPAYRDASILLGGRNFGCGSSREHAVWALRDFGIRAIVAESFGRIFYNNCARNGLLAIEQARADIERLHEQVREAPQRQQVTINLAELYIEAPDGQRFAFDVAESDRMMLLEGLDFIEYTLQHRDDIEAYKTRDRERRPWAYL